MKMLICYMLYAMAIVFGLDNAIVTVIPPLVTAETYWNENLFILFKWSYANAWFILTRSLWYTVCEMIEYDFFVMMCFNTILRLDRFLIIKKYQHNLCQYLFAYFNDEDERNRPPTCKSFLY